MSEPTSVDNGEREADGERGREGGRDYQRE